MEPMKNLTLVVLIVACLAVAGCGQSDDQAQGGLGSAISGVFGQSEDEKALHQAQREKINHLKEKQKSLQKARTEAVLSTRQEGDPVTP